MDVVSVLGFVLLGVVVAALGTIIGAGGGIDFCASISLLLSRMDASYGSRYILVYGNL